MKEITLEELNSTFGGKNIQDIANSLLPLVNQYPDIYNIIEAINNQDYHQALTLIQKFVSDHPDMAYLFEE